MKNSRVYIKPFLNENGTPIQPFKNYDLSSPRQLELVIGNIGLSRNKIVEKFTGDIPLSLLEFERLFHGSGYDDWIQFEDREGAIQNSDIYNLPTYKKRYKKNKEDADAVDVSKFKEKDVKQMGMDEVLEKLSRWNDYDVDDKGNFVKKDKPDPLRSELMDIGRIMSGSPTWFQNKNIEDCGATVYWYLDLYSMEDQFKENDIYLTADFVTDFTEFKIPFNVIKENTKEANFYQEIFKQIKENVPSRKIAERVSRPHENLTISHNQINNMKQLTAVTWKR